MANDQTIAEAAERITRTYYHGMDGEHFDIEDKIQIVGDVLAHYQQKYGAMVDDGQSPAMPNQEAFREEYLTQLSNIARTATIGNEFLDPFSLTITQLPTEQELQTLRMAMDEAARAGTILPAIYDPRWQTMYREKFEELKIQSQMEIANQLKKEQESVPINLVYGGGQTGVSQTGGNNVIGA